MDTEDGPVFIKNLAHFVRTHEKALANALQLRRQPAKNAQGHGPSSAASSPATPSATASGSSASQAFFSSSSPSSISSSSTATMLAAAFSLPSLTFASQHLRPAKLSLTPHHLFYLLSRFEELTIPVGPMNVRLESIHADAAAGNYVSFLTESQRSKRRPSERDSIHSISSVRSMVTSMSYLWSSLGLSSASTVSKSEKAKAALQADLKYLYSAFTKIPCLRLAPDRKARLIRGYEEFPFDTAVPLWTFKNVSALEIVDVDFRQFFGWDRLADQLRSLSLRRASLDDPADLLVNVVLDDMDKRRRRSSRAHAARSPAWPGASPAVASAEPVTARSAPGSPTPDAPPSPSRSPSSAAMARAGSEGARMLTRPRPRSRSPSQASLARMGSSHGHVHGHVRGGQRLRRSGSGSSTSSAHSSAPYPSGSSSNLLAMVQLPLHKWRFLKHLGLADNGLAALSAASLAPLAHTLYSLDLSANLFVQIPDGLATLTALRALNLSHCMLESLHSLARNPLPAISALNLRANRLRSLAGIERLPSLERLDVRDNKLTDPTELARLTGIPDIREVWVADNPFTKIHGGYRVTIFNLFRHVPGYRDDLILDGAGPSFGEKRQLVERAVEGAAASAAVDRRPPPPVPPKDGPRRPPSAPPLTRPEPIRPASPRSASTASAAGTPVGSVPVGSVPVVGSYPAHSRSHRRRRGPRRRIVELSRGDLHAAASDFLLASPTGELDSYPVSRMPSEYGVAAAAPSAGAGAAPLPPIDTAADAAASAAPTAPPSADHGAAHGAAAAADWSLSSEIYKQKIEALKTEVGNGWLSVLSEGGWDGHRSPTLPAPAGPDFGPATTLRPGATTAPTSPRSITSGGRTLG